MRFSGFLKNQLTAFVDDYKEYYWRTIGATLIYGLLTLVAMGLLLKFSSFDAARNKNQLSLLSYFFNTYSWKSTYSIVDSGKSVFIYFASLFSIGIIRLSEHSEEEKNELSFVSLFKKLHVRDIFALTAVLLFSSALDFGLFQTENSTYRNISNEGVQKWVYTLLWEMRIYVPLILFSVCLYKLTQKAPLKLDFKKTIFLFIALWFYNEFAYEISLFVRSHIFGILLSPFNEENKYLYESLIGTTLIGFYFVGYYSAMVRPLKLLNEDPEKHPR